MIRRRILTSSIASLKQYIVNQFAGCKIIIREGQKTKLLDTGKDKDDLAWRMVDVSYRCEMLLIVY